MGHALFYHLTRSTPEDTVVQLLTRALGAGWRIELRGRDAQGRAFKAKIDPRTLAVVKMRQRGDDDDHRERERHREHRGDQTPRSAAPADAGPLPPGGSRGSIE